MTKIEIWASVDYLNRRYGRGRLVELRHRKTDPRRGVAIVELEDGYRTDVSFSVAAGYVQMYSRKRRAALTQAATPLRPAHRALERLAMLRIRPELADQEELWKAVDEVTGGMAGLARRCRRALAEASKAKASVRRLRKELREIKEVRRTPSSRP